MSRELFIEERFETAEVVEAETLPNGGKRLVFTATVSEADHINKNRRLYPLEVLWPAFEQVNADLAAYPGAVDHPRDGWASFSDNGIRWHNFWLEGKTVKGKGEIIWTQRGRDLAANVEAGVKVGFSTRTWALGEEIDVEGVGKVKRITEMDPPFVDAVVTPSVGHARISGYAREETNKMNELEELKAALEAAQARVAELEAALVAKDEELKAAAEAARPATALAEQLTSTEEKLTAAEVRVAELEGKLAKAAEERAEAKLTSTLHELTESHRFGATIRAKVQDLRKAGVSVTLENLAAVVENFRSLVEAAGAAANEGGEPRGKLENEDAPVDDSNKSAFTEAELAELKEAGLA